MCLIFWRLVCVCVGLAAHAMRLCEDPGSRHPGLGAVLALEPAREMAAEEDPRQIKGKRAAFRDCKTARPPWLCVGNSRQERDAAAAQLSLTQVLLFADS